MGLFDFFRKKRDDLGYDPMNIHLLDMQPGFMLDYQAKTWVVKRVYEYCWGNNIFSYEFVIDAGDEQCVLSAEKGGSGVNVTVEKSIKTRSVDPNLPEYILENEVPPRQLVYGGVTYLYDREGVGECRQEGTDDWSSVVAWDYYDESSTRVLSIEQWGESEFEAYVGYVAQESEFMNILPGDPTN